tara:strand:+ start:1809 stop:2297 length:489 start_codon:yes stop_codon:yes gene_type:complete
MFDSDGWLIPDAVRLRRLADGKLELKVHSDVFCDVAIRRTFPVTDPENYIVLLDSRGAEIGIVKTPSMLRTETRDVLEDELERYYFTTRVQAIQAVTSRHGVTTWELETDRGPRTICLKDRGAIRRMSDRRIILIDMYGIRFDIPDTRKLDPTSQHLIDTET